MFPSGRAGPNLGRRTVVQAQILRLLWFAATASWLTYRAHADNRGRPMPVNDSWIAACCLTCDPPIATLNVNDDEHLVEHEGLRLTTA